MKAISRGGRLGADHDKGRKPKRLPRWGRWLAQRDGRGLCKGSRVSGLVPPRLGTNRSNRGSNVSRPGTARSGGCNGMQKSDQIFARKHCLSVFYINSWAKNNALRHFATPPRQSAPCGWVHSRFRGCRKPAERAPRCGRRGTSHRSGRLTSINENNDWKIPCVSY